ncbi:ATP-grasp domain-containing protein, partial [Acinetobacter baumannii]
GYASLGVQRVNSSKEMSAALTNTKSTFAIINQAIGVQTSNQILVEEFVEGREISVDVMVAQGSVHVLGICSKSEMKAPFFEEISYVMPG